MADRLPIMIELGERARVVGDVRSKGGKSEGYEGKRCDAMRREAMEAAPGKAASPICLAGAD